MSYLYDDYEDKRVRQSTNSNNNGGGIFNINDDERELDDDYQRGGVRLSSNRMWDNQNNTMTASMNVTPKSNVIQRMPTH